MTLLIDPPMWPAHGRRWSHLVSDTSLTELHAFATRAGIPERAFEGDHYDVPEDRYAQLVAAGALPVTSRELLQRLRRSGLRRPKRRGERVLASRGDPAAGHRIDTVLSALAPLGEVAAVHLVLVSGGHLLVERDGEGYLLPRAPVRPGFAPGETASALAAALLGDPGGVAAPRQVGYLRRVPAGALLGGGFEVVLRCPDRLVEAPHPRPRQAALSWVPAGRAVALLPSELAPLALSERHRVRP